MFKYKLGNRDWTYIELPDLDVGNVDDAGSLTLNRHCTNGAGREVLAGVPLGKQAHYEGEFISNRLEYPKWGVRIILQPPPPSDDDQDQEQAEASDSVTETEGTEATSYTVSTGPSDEREEEDEGSNRVLEPGSDDEQEDQELEAADTGRQHDEGQDQEEEEDDDEEGTRKLKKLRIMEPGPSAVEHEEQQAEGADSVPQLSEGQEEQEEDEAEDDSGPESGNEQEEDLVAHFKAHTSVIVAGGRNLTRRHYGIFSKSQGVEIRHSEGEDPPAGLEWTSDTSSNITVATIRAIYTY